MIEFVERPRPPALTEQRAALLETATNRKAICIALNGHAARYVQNALRAWLRTQHCTLHYKTSADGTAIICWAERTGRER